MGDLCSKIESLHQKSIFEVVRIIIVIMCGREAITFMFDCMLIVLWRSGTCCLWFLLGTPSTTRRANLQANAVSWSQSDCVSVWKDISTTPDSIATTLHCWQIKSLCNVCCTRKLIDNKGSMASCLSRIVRNHSRYHNRNMLQRQCLWDDDIAHHVTATFLSVVLGQQNANRKPQPW